LEHSGIHWLDGGNTQNWWEGCNQVSAGCDGCYAMQDNTRFKRVIWNAKPRRTSAANWKMPFLWNRKAAHDGVRIKVMVMSLGDFLDNQAEESWRVEAWNIMRQCKNLDWLIVIKRPQNFSRMLPPDWGDGWDHVWLGVSAENQTEADRRIPILLETPAKLRWVSGEPLLGPINLRRYLARLDWIVVGGESHTGWRPMDFAWVEDIRDQCAGFGVPFFMKQVAAFRPTDDMIPAHLLIR